MGYVRTYEYTTVVGVFFNSIPFIIFALLCSLTPSSNSDLGSHSRLFSPLYAAVRALHFYREESSAISSIVGSRRMATELSHLYMTALNTSRDLHVLLLEYQHLWTNHAVAATATAKEKRVVFSLHFAVELRARRQKSLHHLVLPGVTCCVEEGPHGVFVPRVQVAPIFDEFLVEFREVLERRQSDSYIPYNTCGRRSTCYCTTVMNWRLSSSRGGDSAVCRELYCSREPEEFRCSPSVRLRFWVRSSSVEMRGSIGTSTPYVRTVPHRMFQLRLGGGVRSDTREDNMLHTEHIPGS